MTDFDTEMAFIRSLSVRGLVLSGELSQEDKRERIRTAILSQNLERHRFGMGPNHTSETYAQAYRRCYGRALEMRRAPRAPATPFVPAISPDKKTTEPEDDDDEDRP
jgi:hypothetical protein